MVTIEIDGKTLEVESGSMIIEAADAADIYIPRFCYHKKLTIAANCRMCLVEVEKSPKPLPACATPVTDGMKVLTKSTKAIEAQNGVMGYLLINHPLDCPVCDQGGECELQDLSMGFGRDNSLFNEGKRSIHDPSLGPLIESEMTRCIYCTRCVRFGQEIAGVRELGVIGRGEDSVITTYIKQTLTSELSGNVIDLCPVGALTSKPYRFKARSWEMLQTPSVSPHDCIGSNLNVHSRRGEVMRVVPRDNEDVNETWISDRDRFSYLGLYPGRLTTPMIKRLGVWEKCDWTTAFQFIVEQLQKIIKTDGPEQIAAVASPSSTVEELFLLQKLMRSLGCHNIDHRIHQTDFSDQANLGIYPGLPIPIKEIVDQNKILLIGANVQREQPMAAHWIRQASLRDAEVLAINPVDYEYYFNVNKKVLVNLYEWPLFLAQVAKALSEQSDKSSLAQAYQDLLAPITPTEDARQIAEKLRHGDKKLILLGALAMNHPQAALLRGLAELLTELTGAQLGFLTEGANSAGAWLAGAVPHRLAAGNPAPQVGLDMTQMFAAARKAYIFMGIEPDQDCVNPALVAKALQAADCVIALSAYQNDFLETHADVLLPIVPFTETDGTYINIEGRWQSFKAVTNPTGDARPAWKVLRVLGNFCNLTGFDYVNSETIRDELRLVTPEGIKSKVTWAPSTESLKPRANGLTRITEWPLYRSDSLVRRSKALQECAANERLGIYLSEQTAKRYRINGARHVIAKQGAAQVKLPLCFDERIPDNFVWIPAGYPETAALGEPFGAIELMADHD